MTQGEVAAEMERVAAAVDREFDVLLPVPADPRRRLFDAMRHAGIGGGKRLRPLLVVATADLLNVSRDESLRAGVGVEAMHVYSLIHDDLPCMDDDDLRRGKPTVHKAFDEATAVLAGDAFQALAFEILSDGQMFPDPFIRAEMVSSLARAVGVHGMVGGQMMDIVAETESFDLSMTARLQQMKTGALIAASVDIGAILGRLPPAGRTGLNAYAHDLGLAFQIADDLLDETGSMGAVGKAVGKDAAAGKATMVQHMGAPRARDQANMLVQQAKAHLAPFGERAALLDAIADYVINRDR